MFTKKIDSGTVIQTGLPLGHIPPEWKNVFNDLLDRFGVNGNPYSKSFFIERVENGYSQDKYTIREEYSDLSDLEKFLVCRDWSTFGGFVSGSIVTVYTD